MTGATFGSFELLERLGAGGMAEVFLARTPDGQTVVLKRILPHLASEKRIVDLFVREVELASTLRHENIVRIYEAGTLEGLGYLSMELIAGLSLEELALRSWDHGRELPRDLILHAAADAALGLDYAYFLPGPHGPLHLVHRDLSPDNLMVDLQGVTKVLDFGIAKAEHSDDITRTGELRGKLPYLPPEQILGEEADHQGDLYSLGITLYWLLTKSRPFDEKTPFSLIRSIIEENPRPPAGVEPPLAEYLLRMIARDRTMRPGRGVEVAGFLRGMTTTGRAEVASVVNEVRSLERVSDVSSSATIPELCDADDEHSMRELIEHARADVAAVKAFPRPITALSELADEAITVAIPVVDQTLSVPPLVTEDFGGESIQTDTMPLMEPAPGGPLPAGLLEQLPAPPRAIHDDDEVFSLTLERDRRRRFAYAALGALLVFVAVAATWVIIEGGRETLAPPPLTMEMNPAPAGREVRVHAPPQVEWWLDGKRLHKGAGSFFVDDGVRELIAWDTERDVHTPVALDEGVIDYAALPLGKLELRVTRGAEIRAGRLTLGTAPLRPLELVVGTHRFEFERAGRVERRTVEIRADETTKLKLSLRSSR